MSRQEVRRLNLQAKADRDKARERWEDAADAVPVRTSRPTKRRRTTLQSSQATQSIVEEPVDTPTVDSHSERRHYEKLRPDNILVPVQALESLLRRSKVCCPKCNNQIDKPRLEKIEQYGWGAEIYIHCLSCKEDVTVLDSPNKTHNVQAWENPEGENTNLSKMFAYPLNYTWVMALQDLGLGITDGVKLMAFLGVSSTGGGRKYADWSLMEHYFVGLQEEELATDVMSENLEEELRLTKEDFQKKYNEWRASADGKAASEKDRQRMRLAIFHIPAVHEHSLWLETDQGKKATAAEKEAKFQELLNERFHLPGNEETILGQPIGGTFAMDGAWSKRAIGTSAGHSPTSHHMAIGVRSGKICNVVIYSQKCRKCERAKRDRVQVAPHRCGKNYAKSSSSKSMEPSGAVQNVIDIYVKSGGRFYCYQIVTDDDSTVRANTKHSLEAKLKKDKPEAASTLTADNYKSRVYYKKSYKYILGMPKDEKGHYIPDLGKVPINIPGVYSWLADKGHRVKVMGKAMYSIVKDGVKGYKQFFKAHNAEQVKQDARDYLLNDRTNMDLGVDKFVEYAPCMVKHRFDDHSCCQSRWCKLKAFEEAGDSKGAKEYREKHPNKFKSKTFKVEIPKPKSKKNATAAPDAARDSTTSSATSTKKSTEKTGKKGKTKKKEKDDSEKEFKEVDLFGAVWAKLSDYFTEDRLLQVFHRWHTNANESANHSVATCAPKHKYYGGSKSLSDRVNWVVIKLSSGYRKGLERLHGKLSIPMPETLRQWAQKQDDRKEDEDKRRKTPEYHANRKRRRNERMRKWQEAEAKSKKDGFDYGSGMDFEKPKEEQDEAEKVSYESEVEPELEGLVHPDPVDDDDYESI